MTPTVAELLARKQQLIERLQEERRLNEQDEIERLLAGINVALNRLDAPPIEGRAMRRRPPVRGGGGMPHRIMASSVSVP